MYCGDAGYAGYAGGACAPTIGGYGGYAGGACAPTIGACAPLAAPICAPTMLAAPVQTGAVEAWGRPVWKKKWLLGKWQYAGIEDVKYVPRATAIAPTMCAAPAQVYAQEYTTSAACAPTVSYGGACATGYAGGYDAGACGTGFAGGYGGCY